MKQLALLLLSMSGCCSHEYRERAATERVTHAIEARLRVDAKELTPRTPTGIGSAGIDITYKQEW